MNIRTEFLSLWGKFDKNVKMIWLLCVLILIINTVGLFFLDNPTITFYKHLIMVALIGGEFWFVFKEIQLLRVKEKFKEL